MGAEIGWVRFLAVLALALLLGSTGAHVAQSKSIESLQAIVCGDGGPPEFIAEVRKGASTALAGKLSQAGTDLVTLEAMAADGRTPECREAAIPAAVEAYLALDPEGEGSAQALLGKVDEAGSSELAFARALAAISRFQQMLLVIGLPPDEVLVEAITTVLSGGTAEIRELTIDGSNAAVRKAVGQVTQQFLFLLGRSIFGEQMCQAFRDLAINAPTPEFRDAVAGAFVGAGCVPQTVEGLTALATEGESEALRSAAATPLSEALSAGELGNEDLKEMALDRSTSPQHRRAAGLALGLRWQQVVTVDADTGNPVADGTDLIKFAAEHWVAHPGLVVAVRAPLAAFFAQ